MAEIDDLLESLESVLPRISAVNYRHGGAVNDVYEGYLWSEVIRVAKSEAPPWHVRYINAGPNSDNFIFRRAPGHIYSLNNFSYAELTRPGKALEVHLGIKIMGASGVAHEFDVVVLTKVEADIARAHRRDPSASGVRFHLEAKFYNGDLSLGIARSMVGLAAECNLKAHLVSPGSAPDSIRTLLKHYNSVYLHDVLPHQPGPAYLENCIRAALRYA